jgi:sugar phosphate isomerase/epimerase
MVHYPEFIAKLKEIGFTGELIIEREISEQEGQNADIADTVKYLKELI